MMRQGDVCEAYFTIGWLFSPDQTRENPSRKIFAMPYPDNFPERYWHMHGSMTI